MKIQIIAFVTALLVSGLGANAQEHDLQPDLSSKRIVGMEFGANTGLVSIERRIVAKPNYNFHIGFGLNPAVAVVTGGVPGLSFSLNNRICLKNQWLLYAQLRSDILAPTLPVVYLQPMREKQNYFTASILDLGVISGIAYSHKRWEFLLPSPFVGYSLTEVANEDDPSVRVLPCLSLCTRVNFKF